MKFVTIFFTILIIAVSMEVSARNGPVAHLGKVETTDLTAILPVTINNFTDIKSCDLKITYDPLVAIPTAITKGAGLDGNLVFNISTQGVVKIIWNAPIGSVSSLNDGSEMFSIEFSKVGNGTSTLIFDETTDLYDCQFYDANGFLYDLPGDDYYNPGSVTFLSTVSPVITAPVITDISGTDIYLPFTVTDFNNIGAVSLTLNYDSAVLSFKTGENTGNFPGLIIGENSPGTIKIGGISSDSEGVSIEDEAVLFTLNFDYLGGATNLEWFDDGESCEFNSQFPEYNVLEDTPQSAFYINGSVGIYEDTPEITVGSVTNPETCAGQGIIPLIFTNIPDGPYTITYDGGSFSNVTVSDGSATISTPAGTYNNLQITVNEITSALGVHVVLTDPAPPDQPLISANGPTAFCEGGSVVLSSSEAVSYEWSTGETTQSITVSASGSYSVTVKNAKGCSATSETVEVTVEPRPEEPSKENCWDEFSFNTNTCEWENIGTQPEEPAVECYQTATWNETTCSWDVTGTQPEAPATECWETATWNETTCSWNVTGTQPVVPTAENCWDEFVFNNTTCQWENMGEEPVEPTPVNCWDEFSFNTNTCEWENIRTQPEEPAVECFQTATWNETTCCWDVSGTQPEAPATECWETATWNETACSWDVTGTQPAMPTVENCWDEFVFNNTTCQWENMGEEPVEPTPVNCWDKFTLNTNTCAWENMGTQPEEPAVECYQTATWNENTCSWDVTGTQPDVPSTACWEMVSWNETACSWDVTGTQPAMPTVENCWDEFVFNNTTCHWENVGTKPVEPTKVNAWDEFMFDPDSCVWKNIGIATNVEIRNDKSGINLTFYPNPFSEKATIRYTLPENGQVSIDATGILGNRFKLMSNRQELAGEYFLNVEGDILVAGVYQITLRFSNLNGFEIRSTVRIIKR